MNQVPAANADEPNTSDKGKTSRDGHGGGGWPAGELRRPAQYREAVRGLLATRAGAAAAAQHGRATAAGTVRARPVGWG